MNLSEWAKKIYDEDDFGRSISTTLSGIIGLAIYLQSKDWGLSLFVTVIVFPLLRLIASTAHTRWNETKKQQLETQEALMTFQKFSDEEKKVIKVFVNEGGAVLLWSQMNRANVTVSAVESLVLRGILRNSVTSDGMTETFVIETDVFDMAQRAFASRASPPAALSTPEQR
jgi:ABC-type multidrug transport system fused ATPase/permease subunit